MTDTKAVTLRLEGEALDVLIRFHKAKLRWYGLDSTDPESNELYEELKLLQAKVATWTETLVLQQAPEALA